MNEMLVTLSSNMATAVWLSWLHLVAAGEATSDERGLPQAVPPAPLARVVAAALLAAVALCVLYVLVDPLQRWRLRHIPGPPALPLLGSVPAMMREGGPFFFRRCFAAHGPVFKVAMGRKWVVVVADAELIRQAGQKLRGHVIIEPNLNRGHLWRLDAEGLFQAHGELWRRLRGAWQPAFSAGALSGYLPLMTACGLRLLRQLEAVAAEAEQAEAEEPEPPGGGREEGGKEGGGYVDVWRALGGMTLQVVGSTAYGVEFGTLPSAPSGGGGGGTGEDARGCAATATGAAAADGAAVNGGGDAAGGGDGGGGGKYGQRLAVACSDAFRFGSALHGSIYQRLGLLLPELVPALVPLAHALPDPPFKRLQEARSTLLGACLELIRSWRQQHAAGGNGGGEELAAAEAAAAAAAAPAGPEEAAAAEGAATAAAGARGADGLARPEGKQPTAAAAAGDDASGGGGSAVGAVAAGSFLDLMLAARDGARGGAALSDRMVASQVQTFLLAGYETTANALAFAIYCVASHPDVEARLLAEVDAVLAPGSCPTESDLPRLPYTEAVFNEALRLFPPAHATTRIVEDGAPLQLGGVALPPHTPLILAIYSAHHDPAVWPRPEEFIPERFLPSSALHPEVAARVPGAHAPFGYGSRMCIGWKFAVQESKLVLALLYRRLLFRLRPGQVPLPTATALTLAPRDGLWVRPVLRRG